MTAHSQNGWPLLEQRSAPELYVWKIPAKTGAFTLTLRRGPAGFLLAVLALWFAEVIEKVAGKPLDDWGWTAPRPIRGESSGYSNHCSGTAADLNATQHPLAKSGTFTTSEAAKIHKYLKFLGGAIRGGLDYRTRKDAMHWEINQEFEYVARQAKRVAKYPRGRRILEANPTQRKWLALP